MAAPRADNPALEIEEQRSLILSRRWAENLDPSEVEAYLDSLGPERFAAARYLERRQCPFVQPRGGFPRFESQRELSQALDSAGADFIPLTIDSYTRHNEYDIAAQLLQRSEDDEVDLLNGYPLVCHGHKLTRDIYTDIDKPVSLRHGTPDARLLVEIAIGAGITDIEGGGICYCLPYSKSFPLDRSLLYWQYVDRLCVLYSRPDRQIHRESFGPLTATMVPPAMAIAVQLIEALLAAEQGVESMTLSFGQTGSVAQDIATAHALRNLAAEYLAQFGFDKFRHYLAYHQWMGEFPSDPDRATALVNCSALVAAFVGADKIIVKTIDEALGVPRVEVNAAAVRTVRYIFDAFRISEPLDSPEIEAERALIESETRAIMEAIFELPGDIFWQSVFRAFQLGIIDVPFAPHCDNANQLLTIRDDSGGIRISSAGGVPIQSHDMQLEQELMAARSKGQDKPFQQLLADIRKMV